MGLECKWRHARKRWAENLEILKKSQLGVDCGPVELVVYWGPVQLVVEWGPVELLVNLSYVESWS